MAYFMDTCALLNLQEDAFGNSDMGPFSISMITLQELENIKTSIYKDEETKYKARKILHLLEEQEDNYKVINYQMCWDEEITQNYGFMINNDMRIIYTAYKTHPGAIFITDDLACRMLAKRFGLISVGTKTDDIVNYTGYKEINLNEKELADFYSITLQENQNSYKLLNNQYLIIKMGNQTVDLYKWYENKYVKVNYNTFESKMFGKIIPKDEYQKLAMDSLINNQLTVIRGKAGTGKSLMGLAYLFQELEKGRIDKIIMMVNPIATKDSCKFGFLPGTFLEKVLGSQIGHFLSSKLGGIEYVYQLIEQKQLEFIALADARGYDTTGMNCALYITEGQNTSVEQMKLILSRIGEDTIAVIEGDNIFQTDYSVYEGKNNGLRRLCEVYKDEDYFGTVTLKNCYRSRIAAKIDDM